ncbi:ABC transporter ATP-binding protein [Psychrobium sp. nBUS_13]|uniref:ABC transporter ATP-binding protein n=1 Tax=Psychrobium sp. nBUS_13 TaxID=3395319 RepID=UPI003EBE260B
MTAIIKINNVAKSYKSQQVLQALDWEINEGDIVGLLGKNGAGKSTLLKSMLNLSEIDDGSITLFGESHLNLSTDVKSKLGYVPQENDEISWLTVKELIKFRKQFYTQWSDEKVDKLVEQWSIDLDKDVGDLSPGQMQRLLIILALAPMPTLMVLDEPAASLDPAARRLFLKEIISLASEEKVTVIFSTHITSDLERVANKVAILDQGKIRYFDDLDNAKENVVSLSINQQYTDITVPHLLRVKQQNKRLQCVVSKLDQNWLTEMEEQGVDVTVNPLGLEDIFLEITT